MWTIGTILIAVIIIAGMIAIAYVVCTRMGITIPEWVRNIGFIILLVVVGVIAIKFLMTLF